MTARMESLENKKIIIKRELDQAALDLEKAEKESAELLNIIEKQTLNFRDMSKVIDELDQKLEEVEKEANSLQKEYAALRRGQEQKGMTRKA